MKSFVRLLVLGLVLRCSLALAGEAFKAEIAPRPDAGPSLNVVAPVPAGLGLEPGALDLGLSNPPSVGPGAFGSAERNPGQASAAAPSIPALLSPAAATARLDQASAAPGESFSETGSARGPPSAAAVSIPGSDRSGPRSLEGPGFLPRADPEAFERLRQRVLAAVGKYWELPLEELFERSDVLLAGETHRSLSSVSTLSKSMPRLKAAGVSTIGLEGLKAPDQDAVDRYFSEPRAEVPPQALRFSPKREKEYRELFGAAKEHGVRIVALGRPLDYWAHRIVDLARERVADPIEDIHGDIDALINRAGRRYERGFNESVNEVLYTRRNEHMAERLAAAMSPGSKAVALVGDAHLAHPDQLSYFLQWLPVSGFGDLAQELEKRALRAFSVTMTGGVFVSPEDDQRDHRDLLRDTYKLVDQALPEGRPAFLPTSDTTGIYHMGGRYTRTPDPYVQMLSELATEFGKKP